MPTLEFSCPACGGERPENMHVVTAPEGVGIKATCPRCRATMRQSDYMHVEQGNGHKVPCRQCKEPFVPSVKWQEFCTQEGKTCRDDFWNEIKRRERATKKIAEEGEK